MAQEARTLDDLSDPDYDDYCKNPDKYQDLTSSHEKTYRDMMYPDGEDED